MPKSEEKVLAIRQEDASKWERRAPLSPKHVEQLTKNGVKVLVQPCNRRIYTDEAYEKAGAIIQENISEASVIMGIKEVSLETLFPDTTYCFFSHVNKAYERNMPMLDSILEKNIRLIDYETLVGEDGMDPKVAFSKYAGMVGIINILHGLGVRLLSLGHNTPFLHISLTHTYRDSYQAKQAVRDVGYEISRGLVPESIRPLIFVFTGTGSVSEGAQEIFEELPCEYVKVGDLPEVSQRKSENKVYGVVVAIEDSLKRRDGGDFDIEEYFAHPDRYYSVFAEEIAPYATVIINGIFWRPNHPRLLTVSDVKSLLASTFKDKKCLPHRLLAVCDISADPNGSMEFISECTSFDAPFLIYDAEEDKNGEPFSGPGILICSMDNMPSQLALESTDSFGKLILPYMDNILTSDASKPLKEHNFHQSILGSIIASNGSLTPEYQYISELRKKK